MNKNHYLDFFLAQRKWKVKFGQKSRWQYFHFSMSCPFLWLHCSFAVLSIMQIYTEGLCIYLFISISMWWGELLFLACFKIPFVLFLWSKWSLCCWKLEMQEAQSNFRFFLIHVNRVNQSAYLPLAKQLSILISRSLIILSAVECYQKVLSFSSSIIFAFSIWVV